MIGCLSSGDVMFTGGSRFPFALGQGQEASKRAKKVFSRSGRESSVEVGLQLFCL